MISYQKWQFIVDLPTQNGDFLQDIINLAVGNGSVIELDDGKIYRKALYFMVKTMVSCRFSLKPIQ